MVRKSCKDHYVEVEYFDQKLKIYVRKLQNISSLSDIYCYGIVHFIHVICGMLEIYW
jgi:hypothetical protein